VTRNKGEKSAHTFDINRRDLLEAGTGLAALGLLGWPRAVAARQADIWNQGQLAHLIPTANHERILIKASFKSSLTGTPRLTVNGKSVDGVQAGLGDVTGALMFRRFSPRCNMSCGSPIRAALRSAMHGR
jgi:hypothetical protein